MNQRWCWLLGHEWGPWWHDSSYIQSADAQIRWCQRPHARGQYRHTEKVFNFFMNVNGLIYAEDPIAGDPALTKAALGLRSKEQAEYAVKRAQERQRMNPPVPVFGRRGEEFGS